MTRAGVALLATTAAVGVSAAPAQAASTGYVYVGAPIEPGDPVNVVFKAGSGKRNAVVVTRSGRTVTIDDRVTVRAGKGCKPVKRDKTKVRCTVKAEIGSVNVSLGSGNDKVTNRSNLSLLATGGSGSDALIGGSGQDYLFGGTGADRLHGLAGNDYLYGETGADLLVGGTGNDNLTGGRGNDREYGEAGNDSHAQGKEEAGADADLISGGAGTDQISYYARTKPITADSDGVTGDDGRAGEGDTILSAETIIGGLGDDHLYGTGGPDTLSGLAGNDTIVGNGGDDSLQDYAGVNKLYGGDGNDVLESGSGADLLLGGAGVDTVDYRWRFEPVTVDLDDATGDDGRPGERDTVAEIENIRGSQAADVLTGNDGANKLDGGDGDDVIRGGAGDDVLLGGESDGVDQLYGEAGDDYLDGAQDGKIDALDGGDNGPAGDRCLPNSEGDKLVNCER
ncbi:calcium-binding protein [Actinoplanes octamycinicus]|uniref:calcium-binding protein n=1 Tax=Actinoplanes octamycinicus TaxID=135948 RepID=UPI0035EB848F